MEKKNFSFSRVGFSYASNSVLFADRKNQVMMFFGNKTEYIKSMINLVKGSMMAEEAYLDLLEIFTLYKEVSEQELLEQGYTIITNEDNIGVYFILASPPEVITNIGKTVLRKYPKQYMKRFIFYLTILSVAITLSGGYLMAIITIPSIIYTKYYISYEEMEKFCYYKEFLQFTGGKDQQ